MAIKKRVKVEELKSDMVLAAPVLSASGQTLLPAGTHINDTTIQLLKRADIRSVLIQEAQYETPAALPEEKPQAAQPPPAPPKNKLDVSDLQVANNEAALIEELKTSEPSVKFETPPSEHVPVDSIREDDINPDVVQARQSDFKRTARARSQVLAKAHGKKFADIEDVLGKPKQARGEMEESPAELFEDITRDLTHQIIFNNKVDAQTVEMLTKEVVSEMSMRQGVQSLLTQAQSAGSYLLSHMMNVGSYAMYLAMEMGLDYEQVVDASVGGMLHDIGMLSLPKKLLQDRAASHEEKYREQMRTHIEAGIKMVEGIGGSRAEWVEVIRDHHERIDGSGYPAGKRGEQFSLITKIVQVCDVYDAKVTGRAGLGRETPDITMKLLLSQPHLFDRKVVEMFCRMIGFFPIGYKVLLSSGHQAIVVATNQANVFRPVVELITDEMGISLPPSERVRVNMVDRPEIRVERVLM